MAEIVPVEVLVPARFRAFLHAFVLTCPTGFPSKVKTLR